MPTTTDFRFGDVVLVPFPFTDMTVAKKRPAVGVSSDSFNRDRPDVILMAVTSRVRPADANEDPGLQDRKKAGLLKPSVFKPVLATVQKATVLRVLGHLQDGDLEFLRGILKNIIGDCWG